MNNIEEVIKSQCNGYDSHFGYVCFGAEEMPLVKLVSGEMRFIQEFAI